MSLILICQHFFQDNVWDCTICSWRFKLFTLRVSFQIRDGPLENLWGGGGGKYKKKIAQGQI